MKDPRPVSEDLIHCGIADLLRFKGHRLLIWFHPANGEERATRVGVKLKRMGVQAGVADFALTLPDGRSAYIEVKNSKGRQSVEQVVFQSRCDRIETPYAIVRSVDEAERVLTAWGALRGSAAVPVTAPGRVIGPQRANGTYEAEVA
jgi:hypothetical protein